MDPTGEWANASGSNIIKPVEKLTLLTIPKALPTEEG
jgi:hypothetical protein